MDKPESHPHLPSLLLVVGLKEIIKLKKKKAFLSHKQKKWITAVLKILINNLSIIYDLFKLL